MPSQVPASTAHPHTPPPSLLLPPALSPDPREGVPSRRARQRPATQLHSAAQKETQIKCQLIVSVEEVLI